MRAESKFVIPLSTVVLLDSMRRTEGGRLKITLATMLCSIIMVGISAQSPTPAPSPRPAPCTGPEYRQFDFWIGEWDVTTPDGKPAGTNVITSVYGGCALREEWTGAGGFKGGSFNLYDRSRNQWHQTWVDSGGSLLLLDGSFADGKMQLSGRAKTAQGESLQRITWTPMPDGKVRQFWEQSADDGKTWTVAFDGTYTRK